MSKLSQECRCVKQISEMMGAYKNAVVWRTPYHLYADCDWVLSTHSPCPYMRLYNDCTHLGDTAGGVELTECPVNMYIGPSVAKKYRLQFQSAVPMIRSVNGNKHMIYPDQSYYQVKRTHTPGAWKKMIFE